MIAPKTATDYQNDSWVETGCVVLLVCPHCESRYRIDAERVTAQGARARCARCDRLFVVGGQRDHAVLPDPSIGSSEARPTSGSRLASQPVVGPDPFASLDEPEIEFAPVVEPGPTRAEPTAAPAAPVPPPVEVDAVLELIRGGGEQSPPPQVTMCVVRGGGESEQDPAVSSSIPEQHAELVLGDELACRLAEDLIAAVAATYPEKIARARSDGQWEFHLGDVIRGARADFRAAVSAPGDGRDGLFDAALRQLIQEAGNSLLATAADATRDTAADATRDTAADATRDTTAAVIPDAIPGADPGADGEVIGSGGPS